MVQPEVLEELESKKREQTRLLSNFNQDTMDRGKKGRKTRKSLMSRPRMKHAYADCLVVWPCTYVYNLQAHCYCTIFTKNQGLHTIDYKAAQI